MTPTAPDQSAFSSHVDRILEAMSPEPGRVVIKGTGRELTAAQFTNLVDNLARHLSSCGVRAHSVVALAAPISIEAVATRYAIARLGAASTVCPNATAPDRLADFVATVRADFLLCFPTTRTSAETVGTQSDAPAVVCIEALNDSQLVAAVDQAPVAVAVEPAQLAVLVGSGGTTGASKASYRSFAQWVDTADVGSAPNRRQLICNSLAYISQVHVDQTLLGGGTVVLLDHFDAGDVLRTIEAEQITHLCLVEPLLVELADHADIEHSDLSSLVALSHIGADAAPSLRRRLLDRIGPRLVHPYGASEAGIISVLTPADYRLSEPTRLDTCGRVVPGVEVRIESAPGRAVDPGAEGSILIQSSGVASGYVGGDESAFRPDGWYATGDLGYLDGDGYLHVRGRAKDQRMVEGIAVMPLDVQEAFCAHPEVRYAVAIPTESEPAGSEPSGFDALVLLRPDSTLTDDDLRSYIRATAGPHLVPNHLGVAERMPVTEQGKPDRAEIYRLLSESRRALSLHREN
jgi:fatty-acyl-CoA synthase